MHVRRLSALRGLRVSADLHLKDVDGRAEAGLEEIVEDLTALRLRVVGEVTRGRTPSTQSADAVERQTEGDGRHGVGRAEDCGTEEEMDKEHDGDGHGEGRTGLHVGSETAERATGGG